MKSIVSSPPWSSTTGRPLPWISWYSRSPLMSAKARGSSMPVETLPAEPTHRPKHAAVEVGEQPDRSGVEEPQMRPELVRQPDPVVEKVLAGADRGAQMDGGGGVG